MCWEKEKSEWEGDLFVNWNLKYWLKRLGFGFWVMDGWEEI